MKKRYLLFLLLLLFAPRVNAQEVSFSTNYYYSDITDVTHTTGFRSGSSNSVTLYGKEEYPPTYDNYEYLTGLDNYINYSVYTGSIYTVKVFWSASSVSSGTFNPNLVNTRLSSLDFTHGVNGSINYQKTTYTKNNCYNYLSTQYCTYNFITTYTFLASSNATAFRVGTYNNNASSLFGAGNYVTSLVSVNSIDLIVNSDNTIINQNEQIIDNFDKTNDNINKTNEKLDDLEDALTDSSSIDMSSIGDTAGWLPAGPIDSILNLPLTFFNSLSTALSGTCQPLSITIPYVNSNATIPCLSTIFSQITGLTTFWNWVGRIASIYILYKYLIALWEYYDRLTTMQVNFRDDFGGNI